jgi:sec-independent protein translocase protein TatA
MQPIVGEIVGWEFLLVLAVAALLFGSSQIPKLAKSMGQASKEFRKGLEDGADDDDAADQPKTDQPKADQPKQSDA